MPTYSKLPSGKEKHGIRAIKTANGFERIGQLYIKTAERLTKIYESIRSCFAAKKWRYNRPWLYKDKWKY